MACGSALRRWTGWRGPCNDGSIWVGGPGARVADTKGVVRKDRPRTGVRCRGPGRGGETTRPRTGRRTQSRRDTPTSPVWYMKGDPILPQPTVPAFTHGPTPRRPPGRPLDNSLYTTHAPQWGTRTRQNRVPEDDRDKHTPPSKQSPEGVGGGTGRSATTRVTGTHKSECGRECSRRTEDTTGTPIRHLVVTNGTVGTPHLRTRTETSRVPLDCPRIIHTSFLRDRGNCNKATVTTRRTPTRLGAPASRPPLVLRSSNVDETPGHLTRTGRPDPPGGTYTTDGRGLSSHSP